MTMKTPRLVHDWRRSALSTSDDGTRLKRQLTWLTRLLESDDSGAAVQSDPMVYALHQLGRANHWLKPG